MFSSIFQRKFTINGGGLLRNYQNTDLNRLFECYLLLLLYFNVIFFSAEKC